MTLLMAGFTALAACSPPPVVFEDGPVFHSVDDTHDIAEPAGYEFLRMPHHVDNFFLRQIRLRADPMLPPPALDVNRLGEVPSSSWYTNRTGGLSPADVARGAGGNDEGPEAHVPWTITSAKVGGRNPGFVFQDRRGVSYILKVDKIGTPTIATAADAIASRLFWALGYFTPDDRTVIFDRKDLVLGEKAKAQGVSETDIDRVLEDFATRLADGRYRVGASRFLSGKPLGGYWYAGTRKDDPNDRIPHQRRRSLRALRIFGAWLNHVDIKVDNTLDLYTEENGRRFLRHYLVDFDGCLGGYWAARHEKRIGFAYDLDLAELSEGIFELGLEKRPYEDLSDVVDPEIGLFEADLYDPATWKANYLNDQLLSSRPADEFWAGTVLSRLRPEHIAAAVESARFENPTATKTMTDILVRRWEKTVDWALSRVTPVVDLEPRQQGGSVSIEARDALRRAGRPSDLRYDVELLDSQSRSLQLLRKGATSPAVQLPTSMLAGADYRVVRWTASDESGHHLPPSEAHYVRSGETWKLIGILRDGE